MGVSDLVRAPWHIGRAVVCAAEDLNALAERARRDPDPIEEVHALLVSLLSEMRALDRHAVGVDETAREIIVGGRDLRLTGESLDAHTEELISGGRELTEVAKAIASHLAVFEAVLPRVLQALDTVDDLESSLETVADTVEPLQGVAHGVGRVTRRLSAAG